MAPRTEVHSAVDLQQRIAAIAASAKSRNPNGYRLEPVANLRSSEPPASTSNYVNTASGQHIVLLSTAKNVSRVLQKCA